MSFECVCPIQSEDILRRCSIPEWIINGSEDWQGFVNYFSQKISDANIFTDEEIIGLVFAAVGGGLALVFFLSFFFIVPLDAAKNRLQKPTMNSTLKSEKSD